MPAAPVQEESSAFGHLVRMLKPDHVMVMHAYFDESGSHAGSPVICVAGYLFQADQAVRLDEEWAEMLSSFGVTCFHAADCAHAVGEFSRLTPAQRTDLTVSAIGAIKRRMQIGIAVSLNQIDLGPASLESVSAYGFCALNALGGVVHWAEKYGYSGRIAYVFESGHRHRDDVHRAINIIQDNPAGSDRLRYGSHAFAGKRDARPLQAADLLAYEWHKELKRRMQLAGPRSMRRSLRSLLEETHIAKHFTGPEVRRLMSGGWDPAAFREFEVVGGA